MSLMEPHVMGLNPQILGRRPNCISDAVAAELRDMFPDNPTGHLAQALACSKKQSENILSGHLSKAWFTRLVQVFGLGFAINACARIAGETLEQHIERRAASARRQAERLAALQYSLELALDPDTPATIRTPMLVEPRSFDRRSP